MAIVDEGLMRDEIQKLLLGVDLASTSIGKLRAALETSLGLQPGALDAKKDQVNRVLQEELVKKVQASQAPPADDKKRKAEEKAAKEPAAKKDKPDDGKKDKKEKKEKKEKKDKAPEPAKDSDGEEALEAEDMAAEAAPAAATPAAEPAADALALEAAPKEATMGMSAFEDFSEKVPTPQKKATVSRLQTWAVSGAEDGHLRLWDLEGYTCVRTLEGHAGAIRVIVVDWEDMQCLSGADDNMRLWSLKRGGCQRTFTDVEEGCSTVAADWKGQRALGGCGDGYLKLWNMVSGELLSSVLAHAGGVWALEARFAENRVASGGDEHFKVWDLNDWTCLQKIEGHVGGIMSLALEPDSSRVLIGVGSAEQSLRLWDLDSRKPRNLLGHRDAVAHLCADWDSEVACSGGWDAQIRIWNLGKGSCTQNLECKFGRVRSMAVDFAQMQAVCGSSAGTLHFVDLHSGVELRKLEGHVGGVTALQAKF